MLSILPLRQWCVHLCVCRCECACVCARAYCNLPVLSSSVVSALFIKARRHDTPSSPQLQQMDRRRVIIFRGVWKGATVYITQGILLKSRPPSVLNSGLISSLPSCWYATEASERSRWLSWATGGREGGGGRLISRCYLGFYRRAEAEKDTEFVPSGEHACRR